MIQEAEWLSVRVPRRAVHLGWLPGAGCGFDGQMTVKRGGPAAGNLYLHSLRFALSGQASAYGFTLVIWGTGALALHQIRSLDPAQVFCYVAGALAAAVLIVASVFGFRTSFHAEEPVRRAYSAMHLPSVPIAMAAGWSMTLALGGWAGYLMAGFLAVLLHEALLSLEILLALISPSGQDPRRTGAR
jgi:hypothetical protein